MCAALILMLIFLGQFVIKETIIDWQKNISITNVYEILLILNLYATVIIAKINIINRHITEILYDWKYEAIKSRCKYKPAKTWRPSQHSVQSTKQTICHGRPRDPEIFWLLEVVFIVYILK